MLRMFRCTSTDFDTIANFVLVRHLTEPAPYMGQVLSPMHSVASGSEGGQNYVSYHIENFIGRKKYQSVALESSFRMIYCLLIFDDPVNLNVIYNSNIDTYLPVAPAIIKIKSWKLYRRICFIKAHLQICNMTKSDGLDQWRTQDFLKVGPSKNYYTQ